MPNDEKTSLEDFSQDEVNAMGQLYAKLSKDPATRETILRATKKIAPETSIPEIDVLDRVAAATKPYIDKLTKLESDGLKAAQEKALDDARRSLRAAGHSDEEVAEIEKLMLAEKKEGNILTHKKAAEFFKLQKQTATPAPSTIRQTQMPVGKDAVKKAGGIRRWGAMEAESAIRDLRSGAIKLH